MTKNKLVFGIGTMLVLTTTLFLTVPSKVAVAQEEGMMAEEKMMMMPMSKEMMQKMMDEMKKKYPMHADMIDKIQSMSLEDTVKNLFGVMHLEKLLKTHAMHLVEGKAMASNETMMMK